MADFSFTEASQKFSKKRKKSISTKMAATTAAPQMSLDEIVTKLSEDPNFKTENTKANLLTRLGSGLGALSLTPQLADVASGEKGGAQAAIDYFPQVFDRLVKTFKPSTSQSDLEKYNDSASRLVSNLGGDAINDIPFVGKPLRFLADVATDIGFDLGTYLPLEGLLGIGGKVANKVAPVIKTAKGTYKIAEKGLPLYDNVINAVTRVMGKGSEYADDFIRKLDTAYPGMATKVRVLFGKSDAAPLAGKVVDDVASAVDNVVGDAVKVVDSPVASDIMKSTVKKGGKLEQTFEQFKKAVIKNTGQFSSKDAQTWYDMAKNARSTKVTKKSLNAAESFTNAADKKAMREVEKLTKAAGLGKGEADDAVRRIKQLGGTNELTELSSVTARNEAALEISQTVYGEMIENGGVSKLLNTLPDEIAAPIREMVSKMNVADLHYGGNPVKPMIDLAKFGQESRAVLHKALSTLPKPLFDMLKSTKVGLTAAFDNFPVMKDWPIVRDAFQKMLNSNRGAREYGQSVLRYMTRELDNVLKAKGFTGTDVVSAVEYIGRPAWRKRILKNVPNVMEIINDKEMSPLLNTITQLFNEKETLGLLGIRENAGYFARMIDPDNAEAMAAYKKAGLLKSPKAKLSGFAKERAYNIPFNEAQTELAKLGGKYKEDMAYVLATYATKMAQSKNTLSFFATLMDTPLVKLAEDAPDNFVAISEKTIPLFKGYKVHPEVAGVMQKIVEVTQGKYNPAGILKITDYITNLFKSSVTVYFPAFHFRNLMSNVFNIAVSGQNPAGIPRLFRKALDIAKYGKMLEEGKDVAKFGEKILSTVRGKSYTVADLFELTRVNGVRGGQVIESIGKGNALDEIGKNTLGRLKDVAQNAGKRVEGDSRVAMFLSGLERGATPSNAAGMVKKFLFNYDELTDFERNWMKRLIPFYSYMRFNIELQLQLMVQNPKLYSKLLKAGNALAGPENEENVLPDWTKQTLGLDLNGLPGLPNATSGTQIFSPGLGLPPEQLNSIFGRTPRESGENLLGSLNPLLKVPLEQIFDYNLFKGKKISEDTDGTQFKNAPLAIKKFMGYKETAVEMKDRDGNIKKSTRYTVDAQKKYMLNASVGRGSSTTLRLVDLLNNVNSGKGSWVDILPLFTGIKTYSFNIADEQAKREAEKKKRVLNKLLEEGYGKSYTSSSLDAEARQQVIDKYLQ